MGFSINYSSICPMLELCARLNSGHVDKAEILGMLNHDDYMFELSRYRGRVSEQEFAGYFLNIEVLDEDDITNDDLKAHHKYFRHLLDNLDFYMDKETELHRWFTNDVFEEQIKFALEGLPDGLVLPELKFIFTIGIGQSFGYVHGNGMHFDFLQLIREKSLEDFCSSIAHEVHHVGIDQIHESLGIESLSLEELFYVYFSGEGLAVKYCNNAEGVISRPIHDGPVNIGLDSFTWKYLNNDFDNTMKQFKKTIMEIRNGEISSQQELLAHLEDYWMNPLAEGQKKGDVPKLLHFRLYSFGNDIWGVIHDCFGKDTVYQTLRNPKTFPDVFNSCMKKIGRVDAQI